MERPLNLIVELPDSGPPMLYVKELETGMCLNNVVSANINGEGMIVTLKLRFTDITIRSDDHGRHIIASMSDDD